MSNERPKLARLALGLAVCAIFSSAEASPLLPGDFASLGSFTPGSGAFTLNTDTLTMSDGVTSYTGVASGGVAVFTFSSIDLGAAASITASGSMPFAFLSQGSASIHGTIQSNGGSASNFDGTTHAGGAGGFAGGTPGGAGSGPGGGGVSPGVPGAGGGAFGGTGAAGGVGWSGEPGAAGGSSYGDLLTGLIGGSGGGGGNSSWDAGGGGGGGAFELGAAGDILIDFGGGLYFNGGSGAVSGYGASGGGAGGGILLHGGNVTIDGMLSAAGGAGGAGGCCGEGGGGGGGRVDILYVSSYMLIGTINVSGGESGTGGGSFGHGQRSPDTFGATGTVAVEQLTTVPEPAMPALWALALAGLGLVRRARRN